MNKLTRSDLYNLEKYAEVRDDFRNRVMKHKKNRRVAIGDHAALYFEDRMTIQYQVQEMLRVERIFEPDGIEEELDVYNPLIPDGSNWKATFMVEYEDVKERQRALSQMIDIEERVWVKVAGFDRVWAVADEDLERSSTEKTSSVHFLRFELTPDMITAVKSGASVSIGIEHDAYNYMVDPVSDTVRQSLASDLE
jgi:hypothetical protein